MAWACPEHAELWKNVVATCEKYYAERSKAWGKAVNQFEKQWLADYTAANPEPVFPESQPSLFG